MRRDRLISIQRLEGTHDLLCVTDDGVSVIEGSTPIPPGLIVCHDMRTVAPWLDRAPSRVAHDTKLLYGGERDLARITGDHGDTGTMQWLKGIEARAHAHVKVSRATGYDTSTAVPSDVVRELATARASISMELVRRALGDDPDAFERYGRQTYPLARALMEVEIAGIHVDAVYVDEQLRVPHPEPTLRFFRHTRDLIDDDDLVQTRLCPVGGVTGRIRTESGFSCMAIPHGPARRAITSRFTRGEIVSVDFNAIDYRSIVHLTRDLGLIETYGTTRDFHTKTAQIIMGDDSPRSRAIAKSLTYIRAYGGSEDTLVKNIGISRDEVRSLIPKIDLLMAPIFLLREKISKMCRVDGGIEIVPGWKVPVAEDAHAGRVLGLLAQSFSSHVFGLAVVDVVERLRGEAARLIYTVHDELVIDAPPRSDALLWDIKKICERVIPDVLFATRVKIGESYAVTDE